MEDVKQKLDSELLILVDSSCNLNELKSIIKQKSKIITFDYESHILLKENNTEHLVSDIFVKDFHIAQKTCYRLSKWFNDKSISTNLEYKGINLGSLIQEEFRFFLVPYVKKFIEIIEIHKKFKDSEILASPLIYELIICFSDKVKKIGNRQTGINFLNDSISIKITKNTTLRLPAHLYNILKCLSEKILTPIFGLKKIIQRIFCLLNLILLDLEDS